MGDLPYWKADEDTYELMLGLVAENHPDLAEVSEEGILIMFREKATKAAPYGVARKIPDLYRAAWKDQYDQEVVFLVELPADVWTDQQHRVCPTGKPIRHAMLDALLCACHADMDEGGEEDEATGVKYSIAKPDIMAYRDNLGRYGNWFPEPPSDDDEEGEAANPTEGILDMLDDAGATMTVTAGGKSVTVGSGA